MKYNVSELNHRAESGSLIGVFFGALFLVVGWVLKAEGLLHDQKQLFNSTIFVILEIFKTLDLVHDSAVHRSLVQFCGVKL